MEWVNFSPYKCLQWIKVKWLPTKESFLSNSRHFKTFKKCNKSEDPKVLSQCWIVVDKQYKIKTPPNMKVMKIVVMELITLSKIQENLLFHPSQINSNKTKALVRDKIKMKITFKVAILLLKELYRIKIFNKLISCNNNKCFNKAEWSIHNITHYKDRFQRWYHIKPLGNL